MAELPACVKCGAPRIGFSPAGLCPCCLLNEEPVSGPGDIGDSAPTLSLDPPSGGVLATIAASLGTVPFVLLRETQSGEDSDPVVTPAPDSSKDGTVRYRIDGEIARGGMGAVLKGRDSDLNRDVAVKVLHEKLADRPDMVLRFVEEAQIGGQLQHPGIVPIYELGTLADRRPFFSMKLVKGRTLAARLGERKSPGDDLSQFLSDFEKMAQTVAYAHARDVIHRDLKPLNVMVGSFGEVQVMDWGLAKVLPRDGASDDGAPGWVEDRTSITTARSESNERVLSQAGSVMGTPSYMSPEQARGEIGRLDERVDVFALGSILCEILTGKPAFVGGTRREIVEKAERGDLVDAYERLDASGFDADLIALAKSCLAPEMKDRLRSAFEVAASIVAYRQGVENRLHAAEIARAEANARAAEERKRRQWQVGLAASLLALTTLGGASFTYWLQRSQARATRLERRLAEVSLLRDQAVLAPEDVVAWEKAVQAIRALADDLETEGGRSARTEVESLTTMIERGLLDARRVADLRNELVSIRANRHEVGVAGTDSAYTEAFKAAGLNPDASPADAIAFLKGRSVPIAIELASYLDHWADERQSAGRSAVSWQRLLDISRSADPDPLRVRVRNALCNEDHKARLSDLTALADDPKSADLPAATAILLSDALVMAEANERAIALLRRTVIRHPNDVWINLTLAFDLEKLRPVPREEAIRYYTAARALRPNLVTVHMNLGAALLAQDKYAEALDAFGEAVRLKPDLAEARVNFGSALVGQGKYIEAVDAFREAIRLKPDDAIAHHNLGNALSHQGNRSEAVNAFREAIRLKPDYFKAHYNLGIVLFEQEKYTEAVDVFHEAVRLQPDYAEAHYSLGSALGNQDKPGEAVDAFREAIRLQPDFVKAHLGLGVALLAEGKHGEAVDAIREAIRLRPNYAEAYRGLGTALVAQGKYGEAVDACREAIRLQPDLAGVHVNLGAALVAQGKHAEAVDALREAIHMQFDDAEAHCNLGHALRNQGRFREALSELRCGHELGSRRPGWSYPSARWVEDCEKQLELAERLPAVLSGKASVRDLAEGLKMARMCYDQGRHIAAIRLWSEALASDPKLADDRQSETRYNAACSAALAGGGKGKDEPAPDDAAKAKLRRRAFDWLKAELGVWEKVLGSGGLQEREAVVPTLAHWKTDADLAGVRDAGALKTLPEAERKEWEALWSEVDRLIAQAGAKK